MANNVQLGVSVVDNTKQGLSSAFNNTTKMTAKMAKKLVLEVNVAFPNIASKTKDLQSQLSRAFRSMGNIDFVGNRLGKKGNVLSMLGFDGKELRKDMSLDAVKQHLARLKEIQAKLNDNTLVSGSKGEAFKKEQKNISNAIKALEQYKNTLDLIFRTNSKYNTKLTSATAAKQVGAAERAAKVEDNLLRRRYQYELSQLSKKESILERIANLEAKRNNSSTITSKTARLNEERAAIGGMITLYEQLIAIDKRHGADTSANQAKLNALRQEHTQIKNNITATQKAEAAERARLRASSALLGIAKNINQYNNQRNEIKNLGGIQRLNQEYSVVNKTRKAWEAYRQKLVEAGRNANFAAIDRRIAALRQEEKQLYANRIAAQERNRVNRVNAQLEKQYRSQGQLLGRLGSLASRYFSIYTVARFANNVAKTTGFFQQQQVALEGIIGSASKATSIFNDIQNFALQSPFQTKELVDFTKKLSAFGIEPDKLFPTVKELADISTGLGVDMGRIILAYGQVKSASVLRGQELRQFTEAGIPMVQALADKFTKMNGELVTTADIFEMISKRQVSFEVVADVLSDMTKEGGRFYKMQENVTNTLYGQIQKLKDLWTLALKDIGNSAGGFLNGIVSLLQKVVSNAKMVSTALAAAFVGNWIGKNIYGIVRIITHLKAYIRLLRVAATLNKSAFIGFGLGAALAVGVGAFVKIKDELTKVKRKMQEISDSFTKETNKMIDGVNALIKRMRSAAAGSKEWNDALETLKNNYGEYLDVNDAVLQKVIQGIDLNKEEKKSFDDLSESIAAAIKLKKEYEELTAQKNEAENLMSTEFAGMFKRNSKMLVSQIGGKGNLNEFFGTNYDKAISPQISSRVEAIFKSALDAFTSYGKTSFEDFKTIFKTMLNNEFIGSDLKGNSAETIIDSYLKTTFSSISGSSVFAEYLKIVGKLSGEGSSLFDSMVRINRLFEDNKFSPMENTPLGIHNEREDFYRDIFGKGLTSELNAIVNQEGTKKSKNALLELMAIVADTEKGTYDVYVAFDNLLNAVADPERRRVIADAANLYKKHTDALTDDEMALAKNLESITEFSNSVVQLDRKNKFKTQEYFEKWDPSVRGDKTIEQTREEISTEYQSLKKELETYLSKDAEIFANEIKVIQEKMKVLEKIAGSNFYNVDLSEKTRGGAKQLPPELADFLSSLKNAYQRYNESVDKGGIGIGLNYVRTNEMFQEMFGEFFGGAEGEKFKALSGMRVGSQTVGELLSGKFLEGLEEGVIDFKAAALALAEDLENTGIKSYKQAGKQLRQWVDSTISKDSLNATMNELEKTVKDLTNSFEKTNKEIDLYRKLQENGTAKVLGGQLGVTDAMAATPDSVRMQGQIQTLISRLNKQLTAQNIAPLSLGSLSRIDEVYNAIENLGEITMMNNKAFDGTALGKIGGDVTNLLKQLLETLIKEAASISGEVYSGNAMQDLIANVTKRLQSGHIALTSKENIARNLNTYDMAAIKTLVNATQEDAKKIFDQFMSDNRLDVIARKGNGKISDKTLEDLEDKLKDISKDFPALLRDELLSKIKDLRNKVGEYNASIGAWDSFGGAIRDYRNADKIAKDEYDKEIKNNLSYQAMLVAAKSIGDPKEIDRINVALTASNERLKEMGVNGEKLAEDLRKLSLANMQKSIQQCQEQFSSMVNSVNAVVDAAKAFAKTINKVYDVMNDGENPEWMKEMESFLGDFGEAFSEMVAPMMSIISLVATLTTAFVACEAAMTPLLIVMGVLIAVAAIVAGIVAAAQKHDRSLQRNIEDLEEQIEDTQTAMKNLDAAAERMVGIDKFKKQLESLSLNMKIYHDALEQARLEEEKKNTDEDKVKEYKQNAQEALDAFKNGLRGMFDEITGSVDELADAISSAMRSAFQSGENAARNMAAVVKENIGNIVEEIMKMNYLKPAIETAMNTLRGGSEDWFEEQFTDNEGNFDYERALDYFLGRLQNDENVENFENMMNSISTGYIDLYNSLSDTMKEYFSFSSDNSALSGGISGITEDTARTLEGLANSMLMQMILTNRELSTISQSGFAQVQVSWFNDMLQQARATRIASEQIKQILDETRNGVRPLKVEVM
jgi:tape measure domain-containing protein